MYQVQSLSIRRRSAGAGRRTNMGGRVTVYLVMHKTRLVDRSSQVAGGNSRRDPLLAPGFLKGPAGPLSRAPRGGTAQAKQGSKGCAATAKHRKIALVRQMPGEEAMAVFVTAK